jgi:hypothetical protein
MLLHTFDTTSLEAVLNQLILQLLETGSQPGRNRATTVSPVRLNPVIIAKR